MVRIVLAALTAMAIPVGVGGQEPLRIASLEEYRSSWRAIVAEQQADLDADGDLDYLVVHDDAEAAWANALLREGGDFRVIPMPRGEAFELVVAGGKNFVRVGVPTFPKVGSVQGADRYFWYDFYEVSMTGHRRDNAAHGDTYRQMIPVYERRIAELEEQISDLARRADEVSEVLIGFRRDHIARYREFIDRARAIAGRGGGA